jgi:hypothetical protein
MPLCTARTLRRMVFLSAGALMCVRALAQAPILDDVHTVATVQTGVPVEHDFQVFTAGTYSITLTDVGAQATAPAIPVPLASLKMALTTNDALVGTPVVVEGGTATPGSGGTPGVGVLTFTAPASATYPATYRVHVIGAPASGNAPGPIAIQVENTTTNTSVIAFSGDLIGLPVQGLPPTESLLQGSFAISTAGNYQIALADLALPQSLGGLTLILIEPSTGSSYILPDPNNNNAMQETVALAADTYQIYAIGQVATGASGGLFSAVVTPAGGGAAIFGEGVGIGTTVQLGSPVVSAGTYTVVAIDLSFPVGLAQFGAVLLGGGQPQHLTVGGQTVTSLAAGQSGTFTSASSATYQLFAAATPATAAPGAGSYSVQITPSGGTPVLSTARAVTTPGGTVSAYTFSTAIATAGTYSATLSDFQIPAALKLSDLAIVQNGALIGAETTSGTISTSPAAGTVTLLTFAQPNAGGGVMDVSLTSNGGSIVFDQPQGVGVAFSATKISLPNIGTYQFTLSDLQWPAAFGTLAGIVTQGGTIIGQIEGGGTLNSIKANPGNYFVNILATPASGTANPDDAGTYVLNVSPAPPPPTVSLSADETSVAPGGTVHLVWSTTSATSCLASGGGWTGTFTGNQAASGSATSPAISTATTFTLTCTGPGGSQAGSVTVGITASPTGGGGGGAYDRWTLLTLLICLLEARLLRRGSAMRLSYGGRIIGDSMCTSRATPLFHGTASGTGLEDFHSCVDNSCREPAVRAVGQSGARLVERRLVVPEGN